MSTGEVVVGPNRPSVGRPAHLDGWELPPGWRWGDEGVSTPHRHAQQVIDSFGRQLALVTSPDPQHAGWLFAEAKELAHRNHPSIPTAYHFWATYPGSRRGPGYLRRWVTGETIGGRLRRIGTETVPYMLRVLRAAGSAAAYLHDTGSAHGAISPDTMYLTPTGRLYLLGWQWAVPVATLPKGSRPDPRYIPGPAEWGATEWLPTAASDQWQLGAVAFAILTGELPPRTEIPPVRWIRPDVPASVAELLDKALSADPAKRFPTVTAMLKQLERLSGTSSFGGVDEASGEFRSLNEEDRLRWAVGDDYGVLAPLGSGTFGSVWRVRDLSLEREVALKMLHPHIARSESAVARFRREARLAAQLQHPAIVPIYDWDSKGDVQWYIMELEENGSLAELLARDGPRTLEEIAPQIDAILDGLEVAHHAGIIHRDLKPANILIDRYHRWRMADFGIARAMDTDVTGASGTPSFAAPEQLLGESQGAAVDLYAVAGIVVFAMTGKPPFDGHEGRQILAAQLSRQYDFGAMPSQIRSWLETALHPDADQRFPDAQTMRAAWREATLGLVEPITQGRSAVGRVTAAVRGLFG
ncbi:MAG: protein kinase [Gemmatimonadaceae bacterium]|nr:protein kinase [Gemmatimonadaceae bacterium]